MPGAYRSDITLVNWPQIDYFGGPVFGVPEPRGRSATAPPPASSACACSTGCRPRRRARTGAPAGRGCGCAATSWATPTTGSRRALYVRESRRIRGECTVLEQDIAFDVRGEHGAVPYPDAVGIGAYRIDLHPSTGGDPYIDIAVLPVPDPARGARPACGSTTCWPRRRTSRTTHITNGAYRLHPVEWNIGEAAGHVAAFCADRATIPRAVRRDAALLEELQGELAVSGVELSWPNGVRAYLTPAGYSPARRRLPRKERSWLSCSSASRAGR